MEGIGYWIFLLLIYLVSGFLKKRRKDGSQQPMRPNTPFTVPEKKVQPTKDFLKDIFSDFLDEEETEDLVHQEDKVMAHPGRKTDPGVTNEEKTFHPPPKPPRVSKPHSSNISGKKDVAFAHGKGFQLELGVKAIKGNQFGKKIRQGFRSPNTMRTAIIWQEILGKPRALKKNIR